MEGRTRSDPFCWMDGEARGRDRGQSGVEMNRGKEYGGVKWQRWQERERGQCHAGGLGLYFQGDKRPIADSLMGVINFRSPRCVGIWQCYRS